MIRAATFLDLPVLLDMGESMVAESPQMRRLGFDRGRLAETLGMVIESPQGFLLVNERDGCIGGAMVAIGVPNWFSNALIATELALYVRPEYRGTLIARGLIRRFRSWKDEIGACIVTAGVSTGLGVESTARLYEACGFQRCGIILEGV